MPFCGKPKVTVADEAISRLEVTVLAVFMYILLDFKERFGISTVFITHDLSAANDLGGEIMVMQRGRTVETRTSVGVMKHPSLPYTRHLLESIPSPDPDQRWADRSGPVEEPEQAIAAAGEPSAIPR